MVRIKLSDDLLERYNRYAQLTDQTVKEALNEALDDWMNTVGEGDMELTTGIAIDTDAVRMGLPVVPMPCVPRTLQLH
jgi:predicted transcriptional regulator